MNVFRLLPVLISFLLLAAHFMHAGRTFLIILMLVLPLLLIPRRRWVPWVFQLVLILGAIEWLRTLVAIAQTRVSFGEPWIRMAAILGVVAVVWALVLAAVPSPSCDRLFADLPKDAWLVRWRADTTCSEYPPFATIVFHRGEAISAVLFGGVSLSTS